MKNMKFTLFSILLLLLSASLATASPVELRLDKNSVDIGTFYNGTTVVATGTVPAGAEAVVRVSGKPQEIHLKKKGKAAGILWMNIGDLTFENAPRIYMLYTADSGEKYLSDTKLGFSLPSLRNRIEILPEGEDKVFFFQEFLKLKKKESVYAEYPGSLTYTDNDAGTRQFTVTLQVPPRMSPDAYSIDVFAVQEDQVIGQAGDVLQVKMVSFPEMISKLAYQRSLLYGVLAVLVAVAAGLLMGVLFRDKGGAH